MFARLNLANALLIVGFIVLGVSAMVPRWTAQRVARVEARAERMAKKLLELAIAAEPLRLDDRDQHLQLLEAFIRACDEELLLPASSFPLPEPVALPTADGDPARACFRGKHYLYCVTREPLPVPRPPDFDPEALRPFEIYAWPASALSPGRSAFFFPQSGQAAYTRNLHANYTGDRRIPRAGVGRPRAQIEDSSYRARDDERWMIIP